MILNNTSMVNQNNDVNSVRLGDETKMFSSPMRNVQEFIKNRPPIVICALCLIIAALATFSFAFYIEHSGDVINNESEDSWLSLLNHINQLTTCVTQNNVMDKLDLEKFSASVAMPAQIFFSNPSDLMNIQGLVSLEGWTDKCPNKIPKNLQISFSLIKTNASIQDVCILITGPEEFLPKYTNPNCISNFTHKTIANTITTKNNCTNNTPIKIIYNSDRSENYAVYLNQTDKTTIYVHLMWLSYILVLIIIIIFCYALFSSNNENSTRL